MSFFLSGRRTADGTKSVLEVAVPSWMRLRRQIGEERVNIGVDARAKLSPMGGSDGRATIVLPTAYVLDLKATGAVIVHRLPHAAGVGWGRRDRQGHGGQSAHEQQNKQESGGQAVHDWFVVQQLVSQSIGHEGDAAQASGGYVRVPVLLTG